MSIEKLFSYGTLQLEAVQLANFGRKLSGTPDMLTGFELSTLKIKDTNVITISGENTHLIIDYTGNSADQVNGVVFDISGEELAKADSYEAADYKRIQAKLASGIAAWVYVKA